MGENQPLTEADLLTWEALPDNIGVLSHSDLVEGEVRADVEATRDPTSRKSRVSIQFFRAVIEAMAGASGRLEQRLSLDYVATTLHEASVAVLQRTAWTRKPRCQFTPIR
jgi:hypothetical protein